MINFLHNCLLLVLEDRPQPPPCIPHKQHNNQIVLAVNIVELIQEFGPVLIIGPKNTEHLLDDISIEVRAEVNDDFVDAEKEGNLLELEGSVFGK